MTRAVPAIVTALAMALAASATVDAHRLDELLQASRVAVTPASVVVHLDLTPGMALASDTISRLDADGDGRLSPLEAEVYGRTVMSDLDARLDGIRLPLILSRIEVPTADEMHDGVGTIRLELSAQTGGLTPGRHLLELQNAHRPERSEYLANALLPDTSSITILRQERDATQRAFRLQFETHSRADAGGTALWLLGGVALLLTHTRWRWS